MTTLAKVREQLEQARRDCAEAYQVVGQMLGTASERMSWTDDDVVRALDNLSAAANGEPRPHEDLLPWPAAPRADREEKNT